MKINNQARVSVDEYRNCCLLFRWGMYFKVQISQAAIETRLETFYLGSLIYSEPISEDLQYLSTGWK